MINRTESLFAKSYLDQYVTQRLKQMAAEIDVYSGDKLLNTSPEDLVTYFVGRFDIAPLQLLVDQAEVSQEETKVDVSCKRNLFFDSDDEAYYVSGTAFTLHIPFQGNADLFYLRPSRFTLSAPRGRVGNSMLAIIVVHTQHDSVAVRQALDSELGEVRRYVDQIAIDLAPFPDHLRQEAENRIAQRRQKLLDDRNTVASLGYPLRARPDAPITYTAPEVRRKPIHNPPPASAAQYVPEPALAMAQYEAILDIIQSTAKMLERSPARFKQLDEEGLRDQFLVPLNSHFEGQVTGETFNAGGKTDVLVRSGDRTIFIAECKIWRGPKSLTGAVDQLLGYTSWRDTKTAILLFNRDRDLSKVLAEIPTIMAEHPQFKRRLSYAGETAFRCVVANCDDANREITLTVLAFDVPA